MLYLLSMKVKSIPFETMRMIKGQNQHMKKAEALRKLFLYKLSEHHSVLHSFLLHAFCYVIERRIGIKDECLT